MRSSIKLIILAALVALVAPARAEFDLTLSSVSSMSEDFETNVVGKFHQRHSLADQMISRGDEQAGYLLKRITNLSALIESVSFALRSNALAIFDNRADSWIRRNICPSPDLIKARLLLRASVDIKIYSQPSWRLLHDLVNRYVWDSDQPELKQVAKEIYQRRQAEQREVQHLIKEHHMAISSLIVANPEAILTKLDKRINYDNKCMGCNNLEMDPELQMQPMFDHEKDVFHLITVLVDKKLLIEIATSNNLVSQNWKDDSNRSAGTMSDEDIEQLAAHFLN